MTNEERDLITRFIERVAGAQPGFGQGQAPAQPLPPIDRDADALIAELFNRYPEARYRLTQMAFVQEHALVEAQNRINYLQAQLQQAQAAQQQAAQQSAQQGASPWGAAPQQPARGGGGLFGGLFGGGSRSAPPPMPPQQQYAPPPPPPPPQYAGGANPGMFQQGPGFLGTALRTATGVAGGILAADALSSLFSGGRGGGLIGGAQAAEPTGGFTSPWGAPTEQASFSNPGGVDPYDAGGAPKEWADTSSGGDGSGQVDQSAWTPDPGTGGDQGGWQDTSDQSGWDAGGGGDGGGWDDQNT